MTAEELLNQINRLRKDYADDPDDPAGQALHHTFLFLSYQVTLLRKYLQEAAQRDEN